MKYYGRDSPMKKSGQSALRKPEIQDTAALNRKNLIFRASLELKLLTFISLRVILNLDEKFILYFNSIFVFLLGTCGISS